MRLVDFGKTDTAKSHYGVGSLLPELSGRSVKRYYVDSCHFMVRKQCDPCRLRFTHSCFLAMLGLALGL